MIHRTEGEKRYMSGLRNAGSKGFAAGQDPQFHERDNPYKQYEHREFWLHGFRRARNTLPQSNDALEDRT